MDLNRFIYFILVIVSCKASVLQGKELVKVRLQLKWKHQFQFAGYYAAKELGYYEKLGIDVQFYEAKEGQEPALSVFENNAEFGVSTPDLILMRDKGYEPVVLASVFQHSPQVLLTRKDSEIKYVQQLKGKRIALEPHAADIISYLHDEGIDLDDCIILPHAFSVEQLIKNEVDAITAYVSDEPYALNEKGIEFNILSPSMGGIDFYGDVLFTSKSFLKKNKELVRKFREASIKGWEYAMENQLEIAQLIHDKYSDRHTLEHLLFEAKSMEELIFPDVVEIGYTNKGRWDAILKIYKELKMVSQELDLEGLFYDDFYKQRKNLPSAFIYSLIVILLTSYLISYYLYKNAQRLKNEVEQRKKYETELLRIQDELKKSNETKDRFNSIIAHDLRNPFNVIIGFTELLLLNFENKSKEENRKTLEMLNTISLQTYELLNNLLTWSGSQMGKIKFNPENIDLIELVNNNLLYIEKQAEQKNIRITTCIHKKHQVFADENMVNTVIQNLLTNAIKFTHSGGNIKIKTECNSNHCILHIIDTGVGIEKDMIPSIFQMELRAHSVGTNKEPGSGLGLMLCKDFIERNNGEIWVESKLDQGSTFSFSLPTNQGKEHKKT